MGVSQNLDLLLRLLVPNVFSCPFPFPKPFLSRYLLHFMFFLAAVKSWVFNYGQSLEMRPWISYRCLNHLTIIIVCCFSFYYVIIMSISEIDYCVDRSILAVLSNIRWHFNWCHHKWYKERNHSACVYACLGIKGLRNLCHFLNQSSAI